MIFEGEGAMTEHDWNPQNLRFGNIMCVQRKANQIFASENVSTLSGGVSVAAAATQGRDQSSCRHLF